MTDNALLIPPKQWATFADILGDDILDPCGHPSAPINTALDAMYFGSDPKAEPPAAEADGLLADWKGRNVWLFPNHEDRWPKSRGPRPELWHPVAQWIMKAAVSGASPGTSVVALLPAFTDRVYFHRYVIRATAFCLLERRIEMMRPGRPKPVNAGLPLLVALWTREAHVEQRFLAAMEPRGLVVAMG